MKRNRKSSSEEILGGKNRPSIEDEKKNRIKNLACRVHKNSERKFHKGKKTSEKMYANLIFYARLALFPREGEQVEAKG